MTINRILIIEDDEDCGQLTRFQLQQLLGDRVETSLSTSLESSHQLLESGFVPDLVLLDLSLPDGTGVDCVSCVREHLPNAQILVYTGREHDQVVNSCLANGADGYVQKGAGIQSIHDALMEAVIKPIT